MEAGCYIPSFSHASVPPLLPPSLLLPKLRHLYTPSFPHAIPSLPAAITMCISRRVMNKVWPYVWYWCCKIRSCQLLSFSDALFHHLHSRELFKSGGKIKQVWAEESSMPNAHACKASCISMVFLDGSSVCCSRKQPFLLKRYAWTE